MLLPESTFRYGGTIWQKSLPCSDSKESLICSSAPFPIMLSIKPRFWVKRVRPYLCYCNGYTYVNDQPYNEIDYYGPQTGQMKNHFFRSLSFRLIVIPFHLTLLLMKIRKNERRKIARKNSNETG